MSDENGNEQNTGDSQGSSTDTGSGTGNEDRSQWTAEDWQKEADKWKSLSRKHETNASKNSKAAEKLQKIEEEKLSEIEKATQRAEAAEARAKKFELNELRSTVARDKKLPAYLASRLMGDTKEELIADADALLKELEGEKRPPNLQQGNRGKSTKGDDMNSVIRGLRR